MKNNMRRWGVAGMLAGSIWLLGLPVQAVNITLTANPAGGGVVAPTSTNIAAGAYLSIATLPNAWWRFTGWSDGTLNNFEIIQVPPTDTVYTANFAPLAFLRTTNPPTGGTITGGGTNVIGTSVQLTAIPGANSIFSSWTDGNLSNPRMVTINWAQGTTNTFSATFVTSPGSDTIVVNVNGNIGGTVSGGGVYPSGQLVTIGATASNGFTFTQWQDGNSANPRQVTAPMGSGLTNTYTASFTNLVNVIAAAGMGGSVSGGGRYIAGSLAQLVPHPLTGWTFTGWNDGSLANPRFVTVPAQDTVYIANFVSSSAPPPATMATVTLAPNPPTAGTVSGGGTFAIGSTQQVSATANFGWTFTGWSDGNGSNPRSLPIPSNSVTYLANFTQNGVGTVAIGVAASPANSATLLGAGTFSVGTSVLLSAVPSNGWYFVQWNDGSASNPRYITVPGGATTYTALMQAIPATVNVVASPAGGGTVTGSGNYRIGTNIVITATPIPGWVFTGWSDGGVASAHVITVPPGASTYTAAFQPTLPGALGLVSGNWTTGGDASWFPQTAVNHDGLAAGKSGAIGDGQTTWTQFTTNGPGSILFFWKVSSEAGHDFLSFIVDGRTNSISGNVDWAQYAQFLGDGSHTCQWQYAKDGSGAAGADAGWVDQVQWLACPAATNVQQVLFQDPSGLLASWVLSSNSTPAFTRILANTGAWQLKTAGDVDGDGTSDLLFEGPGGGLAVWFMNPDGTTRSTGFLGTVGPWDVRACANYDANPHNEFFFQSAGTVAYWQVLGTGAPTNAVVLGNMGSWLLKSGADISGNNRNALFWQLPNGTAAVWIQTNSLGAIRSQLLGNMGSWEIRGVGNINTNHLSLVGWQTPAGDAAGWLIDSNAVINSVVPWGNTGGWKLRAIAH